MDVYAMTYDVRWADLDANGHVRYSAYIDATADLRYRHFAENGFPPQAFEDLGLGAVYTTVTANFLREVRLGETLTITYQLAGLSPQGIRWRVHHDILKANGKKAATVSLEGSFLNMATRRPALPTPGLLAVLQRIPRAPEFEVMRESRRLK